METNEIAPFYSVWGADNVAYGPVELPTLVNWVRDDRVTSDTWVFFQPDGAWHKAGDRAELKLLFSRKAQAGAPATAENSMPTAGALQRIKVLAGLDARQLESFLKYMEVMECKQFSHVVRKGEHGDAMYLVLDGELRALTLVGGKESTLATLLTGDFFGEISLLDQGPRSADVIANRDSRLLKISASAFERLVREAPALALPFLHAISRSVVGRMRLLTKRYEDSIHWSRTAISKA